MENIVGHITENNETVEGHISEAVVTANPATVRNTDSSYNESVACGGTLVVPDSNVSNSDDSYSVSLPATNDLVLSDSKISNSDGSFSNEIPATTNLVLSDINVSNIGGTFAVTHPAAKDYSIPNTPISNSDDSFQVSLPSAVAHELTDVTHTDSDGSSVVYPSAKPFVCTPATNPSGWYQPSYWPSGWENEITDSDNGFVALVAVYPDCDTYLAVLPTMSASGGTIDFGDGNTGTVGASGVQIEHKFTYSGITTPLTAAGCKFAKVVIKFTGNLVTLDVARQHSSLSGNIFVSNSMVAVKLRTQNTYISIYALSVVGGLNISYWNLENTPLYTGSGITPFYYCLPVQKLVLTNFYSASQYAFSGGRVMNFNISDVDYSGVTNMQFFFNNAWFTDQAIEISINACTNMVAVLYENYGIRSAKFTNTEIVTTINSACYNAHNCQYFEMDDCSSVTDTTNFVHAASGFGTLSGLILTGLPVGINISYQYLDATALNAFMTSLGTASGAQTIIVTGNPGAATCDTSIATAKGFTVTT